MRENKEEKREISNFLNRYFFKGEQFKGFPINFLPMPHLLNSKSAKSIWIINVTSVKGNTNFSFISL